MISKSCFLRYTTFKVPKRKVFKDPSFPTEGEPLKPNTAEGSSSKVSSELKKDGKVCFYLTRCKESSRLAILDFKLSLPRKEVIQPHLPVRLPCYDFTPLTLHTFGASPLSVGPATSGADDSGGVTGGVYKARERIHRGMLIRDY